MAVTNGDMAQHTDNDNEGGWSGTDGADDYNNAIQGVNSESWQVSKNAVETGTLTKSADMTGAKYFAFNMASNLSPYYTDVRVRIRTDASNYEEFIVATSTARKVSGDFKAIVLEFGTGTTTGTLNKASIADVQVVLDNSSSGNIRAVINNWIDAMYFGIGRTIGGSTATDKLFLESHILDTDTNDIYDGCSGKDDGGLFYKTDIKIDTTLGNSYGETITFASGYNTTDVYNLAVVGTSDFQASNILAGDDAVVVNLDTSGATSWQMLGGSIVALGATIFKALQSVKGVVFSNRTSITHNGSNFESNTINTSGLITVASSGTFTKNVINKPSGTIGATCSDLSHLPENEFISDGSGHAIELTTVGNGSMTWDNIASGYALSDGSTGDETIFVNVASGDLEITVGTGYATPTIRTAGANVTVVTGQTILTLTGLPDGIEVRIRQGSYTLQHTQDTSGGLVQYSYTYNGDELVTVSFSGAGIIQSKTLQLTLGATDQTSLVTFVNDPSYT